MHSSAIHVVFQCVSKRYLKNFPALQVQYRITITILATVRLFCWGYCIIFAPVGRILLANLNDIVKRVHWAMCWSNYTLINHVSLCSPYFVFPHKSFRHKTFKNERIKTISLDNLPSYNLSNLSTDSSVSMSFIQSSCDARPRQLCVRDGGERQ